MGAIGNFLWFILGGVLMGLSWWLMGLLAFITIVGIPWGKACFVIGQFAFFPFGKEAVSRKTLNQQDDIGTGALGLVGNIIWFILAGIWLALSGIFPALQQAARQGLLDYNTERIAPSKTGQRFLNRLLQLFLKN